jgi:TonB family protein
MTLTSLWYEGAGKATLLLLAGGASVLLLRRSAASLRHFLWTATFGALLVLPLAMAILPVWSPVSVRVAPTTTATVAPAPTRVAIRIPSEGTSNPPPSPPSRLPLVLLMIWVAGFMAAASRFVVGALRTSRMVRGAAPATYVQATLDQWNQLLAIQTKALESASAPMPLTWGILRPVVVLPARASMWPADRLETVLLHELMHVARRDLLAQTIAQVACSLYWFHPLAWVALRQLRKERERACDDAVLLHGVAAPDYATHLVDLVRSLDANRNAWLDVPAMAETSDLESRVKAMLNRKLNRRPLNARLALAIATAAVAVLLPIAAVTLHAQTAVGTLTGIVTDPTGARIPNCRVVARNLDSGNQEIVAANPAGEYRFAAIPSGRYQLEFASAGFALARKETTLVSGAVARLDAALEVGKLTESVVIRGPKPGSAAVPGPMVHASERIRVGGMVSAAKLVRQPKPVYPAELQQLGIEGTVLIDAIVSKDGTVLNPTVKNTIDPRLATAALDAVRKWVYQPALLNGEPVEVITTISLDFQLGQ